MSPPELPSPAELRALRVLWERGPSTVREVHDRLLETRRVRYTTTLRLLQNAYEKGLVERDDSERSHVYRSAVDRAEVESAMLDEFADSVFEGSTDRLVLRALSAADPTEEELREIRRIVQRLESREAS